jgi:hypothetical protein
MKNKTRIFAGGLIICAAIGFFISWMLMPDPGTTNTVHILGLVKQSRSQVMCSVVIQIITCVLYIVALFLVTQISFPIRKVSLLGICLIGVGILGLCSDAFFHLLAWFMTDDSVTTQKDVVRVMEFMQSDGLRFLIPLLLPFFIGGLILGVGLTQQKVISKISALVTSAAFLAGILMAIGHKMHAYDRSIPVLDILGIFAIGQAIIGFELLIAGRGIKFDHAALDVYR